jgi:hypothetical protein
MQSKVIFQQQCTAKNVCNKINTIVQSAKTFLTNTKS